ncbi:MAG TPA: cytochrome c biogenesis protein CcsA [Bryobacteraceae bacterium]|nr:cytochrome c biogenesis protein CcsA [Bryobacteraceae bacterium]
MSVVWLRSAVALYSLGLLHALLVLARRKHEGLFPIALGTFYTGVVLHTVHIVEHTIAVNHFPVNDFFESVTLCGLIIGVLFLVAYWRYRFESLAVFSFPVVFLLTLVGELGSPMAQWNSAGLRDAWLVVHVVLVLVGYAALVLTAVASIMYLVRERQIKTKRPGGGAANRLPPLNTLDELMSRALSIGFVCITLSVIAGSTWASIEYGTRWIRDPRIAISLVTWGLYLLVVFMRVSAGWRGRRAAVMLLALVGSSALTWAAHTGLRTWLAR